MISADNIGFKVPRVNPQTVRLIGGTPLGVFAVHLQYLLDHTPTRLEEFSG